MMTTSSRKVHPPTNHTKVTYSVQRTIYPLMLVPLALTFSAGVQWHEAYAAANASRRFIVGGLSPGGSVGAVGGWLLGGGHSVGLYFCQFPAPYDLNPR